MSNKQNRFLIFLEQLKIDKSDRYGLAALLIILLMAMLIHFYRESLKPSIVIGAEPWVDEMKYKNKDNLQYVNKNNDENLFSTNDKKSFNPNTASLDELLKIGMPKRVAYTLINYRNKGGSFSSKTDLLKVYGMNDDIFNKISPYLLLPEKIQTESYAFSSKIEETENNTYKPSSTRPKELPFQPIELNEADTQSLIALKGIGKYYAKQIIAYRNRLGGFIKKEQLLEVWGLDSEMYQTIIPQITVNKEKIKPLRLNNISLNQLKRHPYLTWKEANAIINYRNQHGIFRSIYDVENIVLLSDETLEKIYPYLSFTEEQPSNNNIK